jgi:hypothetical protein
MICFPLTTDNRPPITILSIPKQAAYAEPPAAPTESSVSLVQGLWSIYEQSLKNAKYIDLTHTATGLFFGTQSVQAYHRLFTGA